MKMAHKMDALSCSIKANTQNNEMMQQLQKLTPIMYDQAQQMNPDSLMNNYQKFQDSMDEVLVG